MLKFKQVLVLVFVLSLCLCVFAGCQQEEAQTSPTNLTYDKSTGKFSFDALEGVDTYVVGVSKIINDTTGQALQPINAAAPITLPDGSAVYLWSEQAGSVAGLADDDGDGQVSGTVVYREFSSSAETVGAVITDLSKLPVGHYILQAIPTASTALPNPEAAILEFVIAGTLAAPDGFTAQINDQGYMQVTAPSSYYLSCLTETGLPTKMVFEILEGATVVETIEMNDFAYTNSVNGPNKSFSFNNNTVTGKTKLDASKAYTVKVTAVGDGDQIKDASANAYMATSSPAVEIANKYDYTLSGTAGALSVSLSLGTDAAGNNVYELTASVNSVTVLRESGTWTSSAPMEEIEGKKVFPEGTTVTFTTDKTDADAAVMNGVTLTAKTEITENWGQVSTSYVLSGKAALNGVEFEFKAGSSGGGSGGPGGAPGGPGGPPA